MNWRKPLQLAAGALLWIAPLLLVGWVLRSVPLADFLSVLRRLGAAQVAALLLVNVLLIISFGLRWWLILRSQGWPVPYAALASYRLVAFSVSYFTPGPHLGGEPLQAYLIRARHGVPGPVAVASVALDKLLEMLTNFSFLLIGLLVALRLQVFPSLSPPLALTLAALLLSLPLTLTALYSQGKHPVTWLLNRVIPPSSNWAQKIADLVSASEQSMITLYQQHPLVIAQALAVSAVSWLALLAETGLALYFLGLDLSLAQLVVMVTAARIAILLPLPGGLGTLEASQVLMLRLLGFDPAIGLAASLLVHGRDVLFGVVGLWWGSSVVGGWHFLWSKQADS